MGAGILQAPPRSVNRFVYVLLLLALGVCFGFFPKSPAAAAEPQSFAFTIGDIECVSLRDGYFQGPLKTVAPEVSAKELSAFMVSNNVSGELLFTPLSCLFLRLPGVNVLVDTGAGSMVPVRTAGGLQDALKEAGIAPGEVDVVLLSHLHEDHIGGAFERDGKPLFPNATFYASEEEVAFWLDPGTDLGGTLMSLSMRKMVIDHARRFLLFATGRLHTFPAGAEPIPGVRSIPLPGHTPGQVGFIFQSGGETMVYTADAGGNHLVSLQKTDWRFQNDSDAEMAAATRKELWTQIAGEGWYIFAPHFPWPAVGRLAEESGKAVFRPGL